MRLWGQHHGVGLLWVADGEVIIEERRSWRDNHSVGRRHLFFFFFFFFLAAAV